MSSSSTCISQNHPKYRFFFQSLKELKVQILGNKERKVIVATYDRLPLFIQETIEETMEYLSHGTMTADLAEKIIHYTPSTEMKKEEKPHMDQINLASPYSLFHLAVDNVLKKGLWVRIQELEGLARFASAISREVSTETCLRIYCSTSTRVQLEVANIICELNPPKDKINQPDELIAFAENFLKSADSITLLHQTNRN